MKGQCDHIFNAFDHLFPLQLKRVLQERRDIDRRLHQKEEDYTKLDGRLQQNLRDRSALQASVASLEKQLSDINRANHTLKSKVNCVKILWEWDWPLSISK